MFTGLRAGDFELKKYSYYGLIFFYAFAGLNHFIMPDFYYPLIPDYLEPKATYNSVAGIAEILLAIGVYYPLSRKISSFGIILLLMTFVSSHLHFIQLGGCISDSLCVPAWVAWVRLIVVHPLLIYWAYSIRNYKTNQ